MRWRRRQQPPHPDPSLRAFADRAGLHMDYVASLERGERNPPLWTLIRIAAALEVKVADLVPVVPASDLAGESEIVHCPGCDLAEDTIREAYESDEPCPDCGLPAVVIRQVHAARRRAVGPSN